MRQGTSDWMYARLGNATGSHAADVLDVLKRGGESQKRAGYKLRLVAELLTGNPWEENYVSPEMIWGSENEPLAVAAYEMQTDQDADEVGFVLHPTIPRMGGSPDRLIGADGIIECKCPKTTTHIRWMLDGIVPPEHEPQMSFYLSCTGRQYCDFVSFDPRLPRGLQLFVRRLERDEQRIAEIDTAVLAFNREVDDIVERLRALAPEPDAPQQRRSQLNEQLEASLAISDVDFEWAAQGFPERRLDA
jgi:hypothetical protein